jgi:hypothetical protein
VGHANLLDYLMLELADAEREQERRYNQSIHHHSSSEPKHIRWAPSVIKEEDEPEENWDEDASSSDSSDSDSDDEEINFSNDDRFFIEPTPITTSPAFTSSSTRNTSSSVSSPKPYPVAHVREIENIDEEDHYEDDLEEDYADLALTRTNSHSQHPPELLSDEESEDDELSPPSPPQLSFDHFSAAEEREEVLVPSRFSTSTSTTSKKLSTSQSIPPLLVQPLFIRARG